MADRRTDTFSITIARPPQVVFDYLADVSRHGEWSPKPFRVEGATGPVKVGDRFTSLGSRPGHEYIRNEVTVTECSPPRRLVLDSVEKTERFTNTFDLEADGSGTRVTRIVEAPRPPFPLAIVAALVKPDVNKGLAKLKDVLEHS